MSYAIHIATNHLRRDSILYAGCPLLARNGILDPIPSKWLMSLHDDKCSQDTTLTYAFAVRAWLTWLDLRKLHWWQVTLDDISCYKRILIGRRASSTINVALAAISAFHKWTFENHISVALPFKVASAKMARAVSNVPSVKKCTVMQRLPRSHSKMEIEAILVAHPRQSDGLCFRDTLITELGDSCGLRRMEIVALTTVMIDSAQRKNSFFIMRIVETKGSKPRTILIPADLMHRIKRYIALYRSEIVAACNRKRTYRTYDALFLTIHGRPVRREYITAWWATASNIAKIPSSFHNTRHTFITRGCRTLKRNGIPSRRLMQELAGHADEKTTARYDDSHVAEDDDAFMQAILQEAGNA